jgi:hypothetical protein
LRDPGPLVTALLMSRISGFSFAILSGACATIASTRLYPMMAPMPPRPAQRHLSSPDRSWFSVLSATDAM